MSLTAMYHLIPFNKVPIRYASVVCGTPVFLLVIALGMWLYVGSVDSGIAYLRGEPCAIRPASASLGPLFPGKMVNVTFEITNLTGRDGQISGATASCGCMATRDLPTPLPAWKTIVVTVNLTVPKRNGPFEHQVVYYVDLGEQVPLLASISGSVQGD